MTTEKPKTRRVLVTALDRDTGTSKSRTVYGTTPKAVIRSLVKMIEQSGKDGSSAEGTSPAGAGA